MSRPYGKRERVKRARKKPPRNNLRARPPGAVRGPVEEVQAPWGKVFRGVYACFRSLPPSFDKAVRYISGPPTCEFEETSKRWEEIETLLIRFAKKPALRNQLAGILSGCFSSTREHVERLDQLIKVYRELLENEAKRLSRLSDALDSLRLFPPPQDLTRAFLLHKQEALRRLDQARHTLEEAEQKFKPALDIFSGKKSPKRSITKAHLVALLEKEGGLSKNAAAKFGATLLNLADPGRPVKPSTLRKLAYSDTVSSSR